MSSQSTGVQNKQVVEVVASLLLLLVVVVYVLVNSSSRRNTSSMSSSSPVSHRVSRAKSFKLGRPWSALDTTQGAKNKGYCTQDKQGAGSSSSTKSNSSSSISSRSSCNSSSSSDGVVAFEDIVLRSEDKQGGVDYLPQ